MLLEAPGGLRKKIKRVRFLECNALRWVLEFDVDVEHSKYIQFLYYQSKSDAFSLDSLEFCLPFLVGME